MAQAEKAMVEGIKAASDGLRGSIAEELVDGAAGVSHDASKLLKFHGTRLQDNRDLRKARRQHGRGKTFIFMVRNRISGGRITAAQFRSELDIADEFGNGTIRITTRQDIQLLGVCRNDHLGWHEQGNGRWFLGLPIENGRVNDEGPMRLKCALRALFGGLCDNARLTAQQNLLLCDLTPASRPLLEQPLADHGVATVEQISNVRRFSFACLALPTCGLAITESERIMRAIVKEFEAELERLGLQDSQFAVPMTGCPNGCARPPNCDIGAAGRTFDSKTGEGKYTLFVGGNLI